MAEKEGLSREDVWAMRRMFEKVAGEEYDWDVGPEPRGAKKRAARGPAKVIPIDQARKGSSPRAARR